MLTLLLLGLVLAQPAGAGKTSSVLVRLGVVVIGLLLSSTRALSPQLVRSRTYVGVRWALFALIASVVASYVGSPVLRSWVSDDPSVLGYTQLRQVWSVLILGLWMLVIAGSGLALGTWVADRPARMSSLCIAVAMMSGVVAAAVVFTWVGQTGGQFGRYNFIPPFGMGQGLAASIGGLAVVFAPAGFGWTHCSAHRRVLVIILIAFSALSSVVILSRQEQVNTIVRVLVAIAILAVGTRRARVVLAVVAIAVVAIVMAAAQSAMFSSFGDVSDLGSEDWRTRIDLLQASAQIFQAHPISGVGYGLFSFVNDTPVIVSRTFTLVSSPHNGLASFASEGGILMIVSSVILATAIMNAARKRWRNLRVAGSERERSALAAMHAALLLVIASQLLSNSLLLPPPAEYDLVQLSFIYWVFVGAVTSTGMLPVLVKKSRCAS
jgi:O-antigen ligase